MHFFFDLQEKKSYLKFTGLPPPSFLSPPVEVGLPSEGDPEHPLRGRVLVVAPVVAAGLRLVHEVLEVDRLQVDGLVEDDVVAVGEADVARGRVRRGEKLR